MMDAMIDVEAPGVYSTVQDGGRRGYRRYGVVVGGAMDAFALRTANVLVGNDEHAPALELTLAGPRLTLRADALLAVTGADMAPTVDGRRIPLWRPVLARRGSTLAFGAAQTGCRAYLALAGGIAVPRVLGSAATYPRARLGGVHGRPLRAGDALPLGRASAAAAALAAQLRAQAGDGPAAHAPWAAPAGLLPAYGAERVRAVPGREYARFAPAARERFFAAGETFRIAPQSDRMGYRLQTAGPLELERPGDMWSGGVAPGVIQVPPDGQPIVLMADCQTTGGYPRIACVASVDLPVLAQKKPGDRIGFMPIGQEEAERLYRRQESDFALFKSGVLQKYRSL